jgi:two-component system, chemotaxis family, CheB/CheR fusion protein
MSAAAPEIDDGFERLLEYVREHRGFDFTGYKRSTLRRRVGKRMQDIGTDGYGEYLDHLEASADEFGELFATILINVSSFFRDGPVWDYLARHVIGEIVSSKPAGAPIRVWSAGCATGEEPYTIAILFAEALGEEQCRERVKIFATDVDDDALERARQGVYQPSQVENIPPQLLERYFERVNDKFNFSKEVRRSVIFGRNDLVRDAPISKLDLLTCRNTLMYFNAETQDGVMPRLYTALADNGVLVLGKSELLLTFSDALLPLNLSLRIFRKVAGARPRNGVPLVPPARARISEQRSSIPQAVIEAFRVSPIAQLVVDAEGVVVIGNEPLRLLFGLSDNDLGRPLQDLEISYRPIELRSLIEQAASGDARVSSSPVVWRARDGAEHHFEVEVAALRNNGAQTGTSISFLDVTRYTRITTELEESKRDLETAYEELQSTVEELETTNEELQSTNEELETTNEELQSTNEELETMNEELQSSNEELETMNEELRLRTNELNRVNTLVESILTSLGIGVAVVDRELRVQMWNDSAKEMWGVDLDQVRDQHFLNLDIGLPVQSLRDSLRACLTGASTDGEGQIEARDRRGRDIVCRVRVAPLAGVRGDIAGAIVLMEAV